MKHDLNVAARYARGDDDAVDHFTYGVRRLNSIVWMGECQGQALDPAQIGLGDVRVDVGISAGAPDRRALRVSCFASSLVSRSDKAP